MSIEVGVGDNHDAAKRSHRRLSPWDPPGYCSSSTV